jgi:hypothetical protein
MNTLAINRYQFNFKVATPLHLNFYSGSMLRGAFGHALRHISCMTKMKACHTCPLQSTCPYTLIFEPIASEQHRMQNFNQVPAPYIIEPPPLGSKNYQIGETLSFSMVLIGDAIQQLPLVIFAWQRALKRGLGKEQAKAKLINVGLQTAAQSLQIIYQPNITENVYTPEPVKIKALKQTESLSLKINTPLRIQKKGKIISNTMTARDFITALIRRYYLLIELYGEQYQAPDFSALVKQADTITLTPKLRWCEWTRYSNRQQQKMTLGGVLGELTLQGNLTPFLDILNSGQWLHAGNKTSFGMGHYHIVESMND